MEAWGFRGAEPRTVFSREGPAAPSAHSTPPRPQTPSPAASGNATAPPPERAAAAAAGATNRLGWPQDPHATYHLFAFPGEENYSGLKFDVKRRARHDMLFIIFIHSMCFTSSAVSFQSTS